MEQNRLPDWPATGQRPKWPEPALKSTETDLRSLS